MIELITLKERCVDSTKHVFAQLFKDNQMIDDVAWAVYHYMCERLENYTQNNITGIIYLNTPAEECMKRMQRRSRASENSVTLEYLKSLDEKYKIWIESTQLRVLTVDYTQSLEDQCKTIYAFIKKWKN